MNRKPEMPAPPAGIHAKIALVGIAFLTFSTVPPISAQTPPGADAESSAGPRMNRTVFRDEAIASVTAVTQVFGAGQSITAAIVELAEPIAATAIAPDSFTVEDHRILSIRVTATADVAAPSGDGRFVVIALDFADPAATVFAADLEKPPEVVVRQALPLTFASGRTVQPGAMGVINTRVTNLIVDDFSQFRFTDAETGLVLDYNLYIPKGYDPAQAYPLVLFMHDAGVTGSNPRRTLQQGLGAISFASPEDQARHPAFVLAPQFPVALANDAGQTSVYVDLLPRLIARLATEYSIDRNRLYTTGQSGGCMASIALGIAQPDLFAATLCVAGQWDADAVAPLAATRFWAVISEDDAKAYPGMSAIMETLAANGATVTRGSLDARATPEETARAVAAIRDEGEGGNVFFTAFVAGSVLPEDGDTSPGAGHVNTWPYAYAIPALRDWLFEQGK